MDIADSASDREQLDRDLALSAARQHDRPLPFIGQCYNCQSSLIDGARFCDSDCRNDYANRKRCEALRGQ